MDGERTGEYDTYCPDFTVTLVRNALYLILGMAVRLRLAYSTTIP